MQVTSGDRAPASRREQRARWLGGIDLEPLLGAPPHAQMIGHHPPVLDLDDAVARQALRNSDKVEFGAQDSYQLMFALDGADLKRLMDQVPAADMTPAPTGLAAACSRSSPLRAPSGRPRPAPRTTVRMSAV